MFAFGRRRAFQKVFSDSEASNLLVFSGSWAPAGTAKSMFCLRVSGETSRLFQARFTAPGKAPGVWGWEITGVTFGAVVVGGAGPAAPAKLIPALHRGKK